MQNFVRDVDPVKLANAKLQADGGNAALKLMDCIFTTEGIIKSKTP